MAIYTPGQFKKSLQDKIKGLADQNQSVETTPITIKNNSQESFAKPAATYAANEMRQINSSIQSPQSTVRPPQGSFLNKSVRERMQTMAKDLSSTSR